MSKRSVASKDQKSASDVQFNSGLAQSFEQMNLSADRESKARDPAGEGSHSVRRWQIQYNELKFGPSMGKGAYGEVFEGEYRKSVVAIKVYDFRGQLAEQQQAEILHEADLMESLRSEYLVGFRGICFDPRYCLVMEYCAGGSLRARLAKNQEIALPEQLRWAMQTSYGIYQLHSVRIIHRDLKADNILLDAQGHAKVGDFGLSLVKSSSASQSKKSSGNVAGTLPWMAPELFTAKPNTASTDIYSLGVILWEIASRKQPYSDVMPAVIVGMALAGTRPSVEAAWPLVLRTLMQACWDANPQKRPTAEKVGDECKTALDSLEAVPKVMGKSAAELEIERLREQLQQAEYARQAAELKNQQLLEEQEKQSRAKNSASFLPPPKPELKAMDAKALGKLLQLVAEGEQDQAEVIIKQNPSLLSFSGEVKDLSGRTFKAITAFQYALWALDWHMWKMILKHIPPEAAGQQLTDLESKGTEHGKHFSFEPVIQALQTFVDNAAKWSFGKPANDQWCQSVGGAQRLFPAHVVNEYCRSDRGLNPIPRFTEDSLPRRRNFWLQNREQPQGRWEDKEWFTCNYQGGAGISFAFIRAHRAGRWEMGAQSCIGIRVDGGKGSWWNGYGLNEARMDLQALRTLSKVRTEQLESLKSQLTLAARGPTPFK